MDDPDRPAVRPRPSFAHLAPLILILLLASGLRFYRLSAQSFWNDEGNTARLVERPVRLIVEGAAGDIHPPGYYLLLHGWRAFAGESEFSLRAYSALCGVLTVAVTAALMRQVSGRRATRLATPLAALIAALHPLGVYYSQEARMYAQLGLLSALTLWFAARFVGRPKRDRSGALRLTLALGACIAASLYTQYTALLVLVGLNVAFGLHWLLERPLQWRQLGRWMLAHALGGLLFLPWAPIALNATGWRPPDLSRGNALQSLVRTLLVGITLPDTLSPFTLGAAGLLVFLSLVVSLKIRRAAHRFVLWAALDMVTVPLLIIIAAGIYRPAYLKFLMICLAPLAVVLAAPTMGPQEPDAPTRDDLAPSPAGPARRLGNALPRLRQLLALGLLVGLLTPQIASLHHLYTDPAYARDDYRGVAARIREESSPGDAILLNAPNQWEVFTYYYDGSLPVYPAPYRPGKDEAEAWVADKVAAHLGHQLFVLFWGDLESDPTRSIEVALANHAYKARDQWITTIRLARYGTGELVTRPSITAEARLGDLIDYEGYHVPTGSWTPGDIIPITLFWLAHEPVTERLKVFVHLVDGKGNLVAQADGEPQGGLLPTTAWEPGEVVIDRYGILLPDALPTGDYELRTGMYRFSGERLPVLEDGSPPGDTLSLGHVHVIEP
ncbi:MAG: glycosyltransferase family 39 protein [Anaerolineae bacterium]